jgi:hypothetical protein
VKLPLAVTVQRATLQILGGRADQHLVFAAKLDGELRAKASGPGDGPFVSDLRLRIPRGEREVRVRVDGFEPGQLVEGTLRIDYALF